MLYVQLSLLLWVWTYQEISQLPKEAWEDLVWVCARNPESLFGSLTSLFKRVPISKLENGAPVLQE